MIIDSIGATPSRRLLPKGWSSAAYGVLKHIVNWQRADPPDVLHFRQRAVTEDQAVAQDDLRASLVWWQRGISRLRLVALLRRALIDATALALLLALAGRADSSLPIWLTLAIPAVLLAIDLITLGRAPSLGAVAHLLDRKLVLRDQVGTALDLQEGRIETSNQSLRRHVESRATTLVAQTRGQWRVQLVAAKGEWVAALVLGACVALVLSAPRPGVGASVAPSTSHMVAANNTTTTSAPALAVPTVSEGAPLGVHVNVAVISTPATSPTPQSVRTAHGRTGKQFSVPAHNPGAASSSRKGAPKGGNATIKPPSGNPGTAARVGQPASKNGASSTRQSNVPLLTNRRLQHPNTVNGQGRQVGGGQPGAQGAPSRQGAASGNSQGVTSKSVNGNGPQTRRGQNGSVGNRGGAGGGNKNSKIGGAANGAMRNPYGNGFVPDTRGIKPGLITGKTQFSGHGTPGNSTPGSGRGNNETQAPGKQLAGSQGHQLNLQSSYGAARNGRSGKTLPGTGLGSGTNSTVVSSAGDAGSGAIDYVPPDANLVAPADRGLVAGYFARHASQ